MDRNNMTKEQRRATEARGYKQRYTATSDATCFAQNDERCIVHHTGAVRNSAAKMTSYDICPGRTMRNLIKISGVKSYV